MVPKYTLRVIRQYLLLRTKALKTSLWLWVPWNVTEMTLISLATLQHLTHTETKFQGSLSMSQPPELHSHLLLRTVRVLPISQQTIFLRLLVENTDCPTQYSRQPPSKLQRQLYPNSLLCGAAETKWIEPIKKLRATRDQRKLRHQPFQSYSRWESHQPCLGFKATFSVFHSTWRLSQVQERNYLSMALPNPIKTLASLRFQQLFPERLIGNHQKKHPNLSFLTKLKRQLIHWKTTIRFKVLWDKEAWTGTAPISPHWRLAQSRHPRQTELSRNGTSQELIDQSRWQMDLIALTTEASNFLQYIVGIQVIKTRLQTIPPSQCTSLPRTTDNIPKQRVRWICLMKYPTSSRKWPTEIILWQEMKLLTDQCNMNLNL